MNNNAWLVTFKNDWGYGAFSFGIAGIFDNEADAMTKLAELIGEQKELNVAYAVKKVSVDKHEVLVKHDC
jgi:hypothetical protein